MTDPLTAATVPACYVREALAHVRGAQRARVLRDAGIARAELRVTPAQFALVCRGAVRVTDDEAFGYLPRPVPRGAFVVALRLMARCPDLAACIDEATAFYRLFDPAGGWALDVRDGAATVRLVWSSRAQAASIFFTHSTLLSAWRALGWLAGRALPLDGVTLPTRFRRFAGETRYLFGAAPRFGEVAAVHVPAMFLSLPVVRSPPDVATYRRASLRAVLGAPPSDPIEERVRRQLAAARPFADASVARVARELGMARPTLARHLRRLGTSFAAVRDELRRDYAVTLLGRDGLTVADVAEQLGYSEPSAFQRAFKTWTGVPPRRYIRGLR